MVVFDHQFLQEHIADLVDRERHGLRLGAALGDVRVEEFERGLFIAVIGKHRVPDLDRDREDFDVIPFDVAPWQIACRNDNETYMHGGGCRRGEATVMTLLR